MMGYVEQFFLIKATNEPKVLEKSSKIKKLLEDFSYVFQELKSLSLVKSYGHKTRLKLEAQPINYKLIACKKRHLAFLYGLHVA
jgi:hypothetical protein